MIDAAVIALRLVQYATGSILMGSALFFIYALPAGEPFSWRKPLLAWSALALMLASLLGLFAQTIMLAGSVELGLSAESLNAMVTMTAVGKAALFRALLAAVSGLILWRAKPGRRLWSLTAVLGSLCAASFAWMGHAGETEGTGGIWHLLADMVHALSAAVWIGALIAFTLLVRSSSRRGTLAQALRRFSAIGLPLVALLAATGLVNTWFLVGIGHLADLPDSTYGRLLIFKLALFAAMLGLAAANRLHFTRAVGDATHLTGARWSVTVEALLALGVLAAVAWLGMLEPPAGS